MGERRSDDIALEEMAKHLEPALRHRLEQLVAADGRAVKIHELEHDLQLQKDIADECRRQLRSLARQLDEQIAWHRMCPPLVRRS